MRVVLNAVSVHTATSGKNFALKTQAFWLVCILQVRMWLNAHHECGWLVCMHVCGHICMRYTYVSTRMCQVHLRLKADFLILMDNFCASSQLWRPYRRFWRILYATMYVSERICSCVWDLQQNFLILMEVFVCFFRDLKAQRRHVRSRKPLRWSNRLFSNLYLYNRRLRCPRCMYVCVCVCAYFFSIWDWCHPWRHLRSLWTHACMNVCNFFSIQC
jgi:hypothetical protein